MQVIDKIIIIWQILIHPNFPHDIIGNPIFVVIWCAVRDLDAYVINIAKALKALNGLKHVSHNFLLE